MASQPSQPWGCFDLAVMAPFLKPPILFNAAQYDRSGLRYQGDLFPWNTTAKQQYALSYGTKLVNTLQTAMSLNGRLSFWSPRCCSHAILLWTDALDTIRVNGNTTFPDQIRSWRASNYDTQIYIESQCNGTSCSKGCDSSKFCNPHGE